MRGVGTVLFHTCMSFGLLMQVSVLNVDWAIGFGAAGKATSVDGMASVFCWSFAWRASKYMSIGKDDL